jgi:hypothetical protein
VIEVQKKKQRVNDQYMNEAGDLVDDYYDDEDYGEYDDEYGEDSDSDGEHERMTGLSQQLLILMDRSQEEAKQNRRRDNLEGLINHLE